MRRWARGLIVLATLLGSVVITQSPAMADPGCVDKGAYVLFARGSGETIGDWRANKFYWNLIGSEQNPGLFKQEGHEIPTAWAELGNLDGDKTNGQRPDEAGEYQAINVDDWHSLLYYLSMQGGADELVTHLNRRYGSATSPHWVGNCQTETLVLGGYSQGAHVIGTALRSGKLSAEARRHIGYVALYGDPTFDPGTVAQRQNNLFQWWVRGNDLGYRQRSAAFWDTVPNSGILGIPDQYYLPVDYRDRSGSWCAYGDGVCTGTWPSGMDIHSSAYQNFWIGDSAAEIANKTVKRRNWLNPSAPSVLPATYSLTSAETNPAPDLPPPQPIVKQVKRKADHAGNYQLYAATDQAVTEAWWRPGEAVNTSEIIHISQGNIVDFDKVNEPDGTTQSLYTAVPDGVWETWWRPGEGLHHNKIVTGLTGVRQVIADPVTDGGQYTHRLYLLASDGPYEVWWREGGDGIHVNRLDIVNDPITMTKSRGPDGTDQLYVATPTWVYELWWRPNTAVNHGSVINITQGDIRSLDKGANLPDGGQLLYTGTSTTAWQTYWNSSNGTGISHGTITVGQSNAGQIKKTVYNGVHQLYQTNGCRVQENWWNGPSSGSSTLINISQCNITSFDKSADGPDQQVYTASGDLVYETWWRGGSNPSGPNTSVLFKVAR